MDKPLVTITGTVTDLFAHRFVVQSHNGRSLANFGKHNGDAVTLKVGDKVELIGEQKPSELKIHRMTVNGQSMELAHKKKHDDEGRESRIVDPALAIEAVRHENMSVIGQPRRKPKHFELLGKDAHGNLVELHVEFDGKIRETRPVEVGDEKWQMELQAA